MRRTSGNQFSVFVNDRYTIVIIKIKSMQIGKRIKTKKNSVFLGVSKKLNIKKKL